jgi:hypothetical protein
MGRGIFIALLGLGMIFFLGPLVNPYLGFPLLLLGGFLMGFGLIPLRRLTKIVENPAELMISGGQMHYISRGKPIFSVPVKNILDMQYVEKKNAYGISLLLRDEQEIIFHDPRFKSRELFLPYFERRSFSRLGFLKQNKSG